MVRRQEDARSVRNDLSGEGLRVALVVSRFHSDLTSELRAGAEECLRSHGVAPDDIDVFEVPGAWELAQAAARLVRAGAHDAVVALGCVIRGETPHFDYVAGAAARGLGRVALEAEVPLTFGVLTTDTVEQARERAFRDRGNKGGEAAVAALEMVELFRRIG